MADFFSLDALIATATIALIVVGVPMAAVLIRILFILNSVAKIVTTVADGTSRVKTLLAYFFRKSNTKDKKNITK